MLRLRPFLLISILSLNSATHAENYLDPQPDQNDNPSQLQSIPLLQSLKILISNENFRHLIFMI